MKSSIYQVLGTIMVLAAMAVCLVMQHDAVVEEQNRSRELAAELAQRTAEQVSPLPAQEANSPSMGTDEKYELLRLRSEAGRLLQETNSIQRLQEANKQLVAELVRKRENAQNRPSTAADAGGSWPREAWKFQGYATPEAAFLSGLWAANSGDIESFRAAITGDLQDIVEKDLKDKSEAEAGAKAQQETEKMKSCQILSQEPQPDGSVVLTVSLVEEEKSSTEKFIMQRVGEAWKLSGHQD